MKLKKINRFYLKFILRPINTIRLWSVYFYIRVVLMLALRGIKLPGFEKIRKNLPKNASSAYERQTLVFEIKSWQFSIQKGPFWYRKAIEKILDVFQKNQFWIFIFIKTFLAVIFISVPIFLFILTRSILPVPERVPYSHITSTLPKDSNLKTEWLYTEPPFSIHSKNTEPQNSQLDSYMLRGVSITPVLESNAPAGLSHFGIGSYPNQVQLLRGFLTDEEKAITIRRQRNETTDNLGTLRIQYYLFPSPDSDTHQCQIDLFDDLGRKIATETQATPERYDPNPSKMISVLNQNLAPNSIPNTGEIKEFKIKSHNPPRIITSKVTEIKNASLEKRSKQNCIYALGDFSFEHLAKKKLSRRGVIFILVDTLRSQTAYDKKIMPNLHDFSEKSAISFLEHRAQGNMTVPSVIPLMTSRYARELGPIAFTYAADKSIRKDFYAKQYPMMATAFQNLGYRVGAIGWLSLFSEGMQGGMDLGFHNTIISENPQYEARQITEQMGTWLENYGDSPFFLYLHYNTMHGPYKPPLSDLNVWHLIGHPFGLKPRQELYNSLGHYWDREFLNILKKLDELGIKDEVDIVVTADHGAQTKEQPWNYFSGVDKQITGAYMDKGHSLLDEEVHIPFILHLAQSPQTYGKSISIPTAHVDVFPTLYKLAGATSLPQNRRGIDLSPGIQESPEKAVSDATRNRDHIYFDAHRYAGILYWGKDFQHSPQKYIRQFEPDEVRLYLKHNPWSVDLSWYQKEMFSSVDFQHHTETWLPFTSENRLLRLRQVYFQKSVFEKKIRITSKYTGSFSMTILAKNLRNDLISFPSKIKVKFIPKGQNQTLAKIQGHIMKGESIELRLDGIKLHEIHFEQRITPIACSNGISFESSFLNPLLKKGLCGFFPPPDGLIERNYVEKDKPVVIQQILSNEKQEQLEGSGAGAALQQALREWGYAK